MLYENKGGDDIGLLDVFKKKKVELTRRTTKME